MESEYVNYLKREVEQTLGRKILTSIDCRHLYHDIAQQQYKVSFNTLRRFFYLMKSNHQQSPYTLDVLSNYCGFSSFNEFITSYHEPDNDDDKPENKNNDLLDYLVSNFKCTEVASTDDFTFSSLVNQTIIFLGRHPYLIDQFQRRIANTKNGQIFYYEQSVNIDKLASFYGEGIRYYLISKKTIDAHTFGHYLLGFRSWLTMNDKCLNKHYQMEKEGDFERTNTPLLLGYKFALQIYFLNAFKCEHEPLLVKLRQLHSGFTISKDNFTSIFRFEIHLITAQILCAQYEEALFYIDDICKIKKRFSLSNNDLRWFEFIPLYRAIALYHAGEVIKAKEIFNGINPNKFHFLHKQYLTILYLSFKQCLQKRNSEKKQLQSLIEDTGFTRLTTLFK
jgi:hypothetical protein